MWSLKGPIGFLDDFDSTLLPLVTPGRLLGKKDGLDVGEDSALRDSDAGKKFVELLIIPDGQLKVTGDDPGLLVVPGSVPSQLDDLGSKVLHNSSEVDGGTSSNPLGVVAPAEMTMDPSNWELEASPGGP